MTRDQLADLFLVSEFNTRSPLDSRPLFDPAQCTSAEYVAHIRSYKPFALEYAYRMADWAIHVATLAEGLAA
ncbi:hypothetical protein ACFSUK_28610 [Sphingobium scionense]|uniref:Uncharacterized protein n=1 Tax=Sphingobium scionense TaxID=1404341 RepID=A0A7W6LPC0_9SPHN|nr:hypothetical protein [Sphingobium scionense]MBB4148023.1 hypothetical protein [Sphingobium scionense]